VRQINSVRNRHRQTHRGRDTHRQTNPQRWTHTDRNTQSDRHTKSEKCVHACARARTHTKRHRARQRET
jgi:hypothetical protein